VIQNDGNILLSGVFTYFNDTPLNRIARLNENGSLDLSFAPGSGFDEVVRTIALQPDGKILAAGVFTNYNGAAVSRIARLQGSAKERK
jgi:hypothetical protein